jgi:hypothetical protein
MVVAHCGTVEFELHVPLAPESRLRHWLRPERQGSLDVKALSHVARVDLKCQSHRSTWWWWWYWQRNKWNGRI